VGGGEPIQRLQAPHGNEEGERLEGDKKKAPLALEGGLSVSGMCALVALILPTAVDVAAQITWGEWEEMDNAGHWRGPTCRTHARSGFTDTWKETLQRTGTRGQGHLPDLL
jgi:hypothetical protein